MQEQTASIVQVRMQCMKNMGNSPCTVVWQSATWHSYHFGSRPLVTTWTQILQLLQTGAEIWAQFCNCPECWVHPVCCWCCWPKPKFTGCPNTFHGMGDIANISYPEHPVSPQPAYPAPHSWWEHPLTPMGLVMAGCWQINYISNNIGRRNSIRILN